MWSGRIRALAILAAALLWSTLKKLLPSAGTGFARFRAQFASENLLPIDLESRERLFALGRCIACGRCGAGDGPRIAASRNAYPGTMQLVLASTRSMPDFHLAERALAWITEAELAEKESLCPTKVPIHEVVSLVSTYARRS